MNRVILMGRMTKDPTVRYSESNPEMAIGRFFLAVDRRRTKDGNQEADFISCVAFGKTAEFLQKYCHKGTKLVIAGRIQTGSYTDQDGRKVYTTDVVVDETEFAESKKDTTARNAMDDAAAAAYAGDGHKEAAGPMDGFVDIGSIDEELPFT